MMPEPLNPTPPEEDEDNFLSRLRRGMQSEYDLLQAAATAREHRADNFKPWETALVKATREGTDDQFERIDSLFAFGLERISNRRRAEKDPTTPRRGANGFGSTGR